MDEAGERAALDALIARDGVSLAALSRVLGRNAAWMQQYLRRGSPRRLGEEDRGTLARFFGVSPAVLGAAAEPADRRVAWLDLAASAGPGRVAGDEAPVRYAAVGADLAALGVVPASAAMLRVAGDSMAPTLLDGDSILVDRAQAVPERAPGAIWLLREGEMLHVKRLRRQPGGGWCILSDNAPDRHVAADAITCIGLVVWMERRL